LVEQLLGRLAGVFTRFQLYLKSFEFVNDGQVSLLGVEALERLELALDFGGVELGLLAIKLGTLNVVGKSERFPFEVFPSHLHVPGMRLLFVLKNCYLSL
jgi:hypothetical protein